jgi:hypothetical protein
VRRIGVDRLGDAAKISQGRMGRLRRVLPSAHVRQGLDLPPGLLLYSDTQTEAFIVLDADNHIISERKWEEANRWRRTGKTMSFVVRHDLRSLQIFGRPAPIGTESST